MKYTVLTWFVVSVTFVAFSHFNQCFANSEELIASTVSGGNPYKLVTEDQTGTSTMRPGIYVREGADSAEWLLSLPGRFIPVPVRGGLSQLLGMTSQTNRFEAVGVRDGKILVFSVRSRQNNPASLIEVGSERHPIRNPLDGGSVVTMPTITNLNDVTFYSQVISVPGRENVQVLLISVRNPSPNGDGITFALTFEPSQNRGEEIVPLVSPVLLDWNFAADQVALSKRLFLSSSGLFSKNLLSFMLQKSHEKSAVMVGWRELLQGVRDGNIEIEANDNNINSVARQVPYISVVTGQPAIDVLPSVSLSFSVVDLARQIFDPIGGRTGIYIGPDRISSTLVRNLSPVISGEIATDSNGTEMFRTSYISSELAAASFLTTDHRLFLISQTSPFGAIAEMRLRPTEGAYIRAVPSEVAWHVMPGERFIFVSWKFGSVAFTSVYELDTSHNALRLRRSATIGRRFYDADEMSMRIRRLKGVLAFDDFTVAQGMSYNQSYRGTIPHVDITQTLEAANTRNPSIAHFFPEPSVIKKLGAYSNFRFETIDGYANSSGIYVEEAKGPKMVLAGEIVVPPYLNDERGLLDRRSYSNGTMSVDVSFFGIDPSFHGGKKGILIGAVVNSIGASSSTVGRLFSGSPGFRSAIEPEKIKFFEIIGPRVDDKTHPKDPNTQNVLAVLGVQGRGTVAYFLRVHRESNTNTIGITASRDSLLSENFLTMEEIHARLRFDEHHVPYWADSAEIEDDDARYRAVRLDDGNAVQPNSGQFRVKLRKAEEIDIAATAAGSVASWRVHPARKEVSELIGRVRRAAEYQSDAFPHLRDLLDDLANPSKKPEHVVLIVPPELKQYAEQYPLALRSRSKNRPHFWNEENHGLRFYFVDANRADQEQVLGNLGYMHSDDSPSTRSVLFGSIAQVKAIGRPKLTTSSNASNGAAQGFRVVDRKLGQATVDALGEVKNNSQDVGEPASLLYLTATEGQKIDLNSFQNNPPEPKVSTLFVGTEEEWKGVLNSVELEERFGLSSRFRVVKLSPPTKEVRENYVLNMLNLPELQALNYSFSMENLLEEGTEQLTQDERKRRLVRFFVNKVESLSRRNNVALFEGFLQALNVLGYELSNNQKFRNRKIIDRSLLEMTLAKVFPMSINVQLLPPDAPLRIFHRHEEGQEPGEDAAFRWVRAGYYGDLKTKMLVISTILDQLVDDTTKPVPSSMLIHGGTGSGKTALVKTMLKVAGYKLYDFSKSVEQNQDATAFFLPMGTVYDDSGSSSEKGGTSRSKESMRLEEALAHLDKFQALPHAHLAPIILDDMHLPSDKVRSRFLARFREWINNTNEASAKMYEVIGQDGSVVRRPVRNMIPIITMNFTEDKDKIAKIAGKDKEPTVNDKIIATLSSSTGTDVDASFLARLGRIINVDTFPAEAKAPQLTHTLKRAIQDVLENDNKFALVSPRAIQLLVKKFPKLDARGFLSPATRALVQPIRNFPTSAFMVVPKSEWDGSFGAPVSDTPGKNPTVGSQDIEGVVQSSIQALPLEGDGGIRGRLELMRFVTDNFRKHTYEILLMALSSDSRFSRGMEAQKYRGAPLALALHRHMTETPSVPLERMIIEASDFGIKTQNERLAFQRILAGMKFSQYTEFPRSPDVGVVQQADISGILLGQRVSSRARSRQVVLKEAIDHLTPLLVRLLTRSLEVKNLQNLPQSEEWLRNLGTEDELPIETIGRDIVDAIAKYSAGIMSSALLENRNQTEEVRLTQYDAMRFFAIALDKAIARLPWGKVTQFLSQNLVRATRDMSLAQSPGVQHFMFDGKLSPLVSKDQSLVLLLAQSIPFFKDEGEGAQHSRFTSICARQLTVEGK